MTPSVGDFVSVVFVCKNNLKAINKEINSFSEQERRKSLQRLVKDTNASHYHIQPMLAEYL